MDADSLELRRVIRRMLAKVASEIVERDEGSAVLAAYDQAQPDWVLMDIEMAGMDGLTATRQLMAAYPEARVVIVTQYGDVHWRAVATEAGACGYVLKEDLLSLRPLLLCQEMTSS